jgi:hypothetical protein
LGYASARRNGKRAGKRSGLEVKVEEALCKAGLKHEYETLKFSYIQPEQKRSYLADFELKDYPQIVIEAKGRFTSADRKKMLLLQAQYPDTHFVMVFGRSLNTLSKSSNTTYGDWCDKHNIPWLDLYDFLDNPHKCLSFGIKKQVVGNSKSKVKKNSKQSYKRERSLSLRVRRKNTQRKLSLDG